MTLQVNEIFHSIQGESVWAGLPCSFVRLTGCNLRCGYCDTTYAYDAGRPMRIRQIVRTLEKAQCRRVTITGGEPLLQNRTIDLIGTLVQGGYRVSLETNGSLDIRPVATACMVVMDLKCPSSGMHAHNRLDNLRYLKASDQLKFVVADSRDYQFACDIVAQTAGQRDGANILFAPAFGLMPPERLAAWILRDNIDVRLQLQLHRLIWPDQDRGV